MKLKTNLVPKMEPTRIYKAREGKWYTPREYYRKQYLEKLKTKVGLKKED